MLPARETSSVFGTARSLQDTPRSITLIESSLTDLYSIRTVNDFVAVTAGSFTGNDLVVPEKARLRLKPKRRNRKERGEELIKEA